MVDGQAVTDVMPGDEHKVAKHLRLKGVELVTVDQPLARPDSQLNVLRSIRRKLDVVEMVQEELFRG